MRTLARVTIGYVINKKYSEKHMPKTVYIITIVYSVSTKYTKFNHIVLITFWKVRNTCM